MRGPRWREEVVVLISLAEFNEPRNTSPLKGDTCSPFFAFEKVVRFGTLLSTAVKRAHVETEKVPFFFFSFFSPTLDEKKTMETFDFEAWIRENETRNNYARRVEISYLRHFRNWSARIGFGVGGRWYWWFTPRWWIIFLFEWKNVSCSWNGNGCNRLLATSWWKNIFIGSKRTDTSWCFYDVW